jgi:hypothetical protein
MYSRFFVRFGLDDTIYAGEVRDGDRTVAGWQYGYEEKNCRLKGSQRSISMAVGAMTKEPSHNLLKASQQLHSPSPLSTNTL